MEDRPIKVYVKINSAGYVTEICSEPFIKDLTGWTFLDEGYGDKYIHAQHNYYEKPLRNRDGSYNYTFLKSH